MKLEISDNLRALRTKSKKTLEDIAEIIDVSRQTVSKWESGETYPDIENCIKLAKLYDISLDALVNKPIESLINEKSNNEKYIFGLTKLNNNRTINLPQKAVDLLEITINDPLLVLGDKNKGIAIIKCADMDNFIYKDN